MNTEKILRLADTLERLAAAPLPDHPDIGFRMGGYRFQCYGYEQSDHGCGTACCIAGWTVELEDPGVNFGMESHFRARDILGLTDEEADELFTPERPDAHFAADNIGPMRAARVLRHLATTAAVDWSIR